MENFVPAKWKKSPRFRPEVVLKEIAKTRLPKLEGAPMSFSAIGFSQTVPLLHTMLDFPDAAAELDHGALISAAISRVDGELTREAFLLELNRQLDSALSKRINAYRVLTTMSLREILHNSLSCEVDVSPQRQNSPHETGLF
jgi:hypothetical protein